MAGKANHLPKKKPDEDTVLRRRRDRVKEVLRLYWTKLEELRKKNSGKITRGSTVAAAEDLKERAISMDNRKQIGPIMGVLVGDSFQYRAELTVIGLHCQLIDGIDYLRRGGTTLATSIVAGTRYKDYMKCRHVLIYSGHGINVDQDQKLEDGNLALKNCIKSKQAVRVIRHIKHQYIYDGLYTVKFMREKRGELGKKVFEFELWRNSDQPELEMDRQPPLHLCK